LREILGTPPNSLSRLHCGLSRTCQGIQHIHERNIRTGIR